MIWFAMGETKATKGTKDYIVLSILSIKKE